jgi:lipid-binding SYLF domain-containing protein
MLHHRSNNRIRAIVSACTLWVAAGAMPASAQKMEERLDTSGEVLRELINAPDAEIPEELLEDAECVGVIPGVKKAAFGFGGRYGRGVAVCRTNGGNGPWGAPSMLALDGGSFGFQLGGSSMDVVMLFMTPKSMESLLKDKVTLGGDVAAAAGPKGRNASASTDTRFQAEILTYGRSRGLFAGVSLEGASLRPDDDANEEIYGREINAERLLTGQDTGVPAAAAGFMSTLRQIAGQ